MRRGRRRSESFSHNFGQDRLPHNLGDQSSQYDEEKIGIQVMQSVDGIVQLSWWPWSNLYKSDGTVCHETSAVYIRTDVSQRIEELLIERVRSQETDRRQSPPAMPP